MTKNRAGRTPAQGNATQTPEAEPFRKQKEDRDHRGPAHSTRMGQGSRRPMP